MAKRTAPPRPATPPPFAPARRPMPMPMPNLAPAPKPVKPVAMPRAVGTTAEGAVGGAGPFNSVMGRPKNIRGGGSRRRKSGGVGGAYD